MVLWVDQDGLIVGVQQNPENGLTWEDTTDQGHYFNESDYAYVEEVEQIKSIAEIKASFAALPKSA
jgi:hypothetical protein